MAKAKDLILSYDSIAAAAAALGIEKSILQRAKRAGAPGFRGSRVYPAELLPWLAQNSKPESAAELPEKDLLERQLLQGKIEAQQFDFSERRRQFFRVTEGQQWTAAMIGEFRKVLEAIPSTLAPDIVGCGSIPEAELRIRGAIDQALNLLHSGPWSNDVINSPRKE